MNPLDIIRSIKGGRFMSVTYTNQKGEVKRYTCRTGVKKHLRGGIKVHTPNSITVYSMSINNMGYKTFVESQINSIRCGKISYNKE